MVSAILKEKCNVLVEPVLPQDYVSFFEEMTIEAEKIVKEYGVNKQGAKIQLQRIGFDINLILLRENFKLLNDKPDLKLIAKQIGYIVLLKIYFTNHWLYWEDWEEDYLKLESRIKGLPESKKNKALVQSQTSVTFKWTGKDIDGDMEQLLMLLKSKKVVDYSTTKEQLIDFFSGKEIDKITPIRWGEENTAQVAYFYFALMENGLIEKTERYQWGKIEKCILPPVGGASKFKNFKSYKSLIVKGKTEEVLSVEKIKIIDDILRVMQ